jgi:hypothetical protein
MLGREKVNTMARVNQSSPKNIAARMIPIPSAMENRQPRDLARFLTPRNPVVSYRQIDSKKDLPQIANPPSSKGSFTMSNNNIKDPENRGYGALPLFSSLFLWMKRVDIYTDSILSHYPSSIVDRFTHSIISSLAHLFCGNE